MYFAFLGIAGSRIVDAENEEQLRIRFAEEPWTRIGRLEMASVKPRTSAKVKLNAAACLRAASNSDMEWNTAVTIPGSDDPSRAARHLALREILRAAAGYWEPRRITYNAILATIVVAWVVAAWPHFRPALTPQSLLLTLVLAAIANVCYCAAYLVEVAMRLSRFRYAWPKRRWALWFAGTLLAGVLTCYWIADEIYPFVRPV